jgi:hypothetical protein
LGDRCWPCITTQVERICEIWGIVWSRRKPLTWNVVLLSLLVGAVVERLPVGVKYQATEKLSMGSSVYWAITPLQSFKLKFQNFKTELSPDSSKRPDHSQPCLKLNREVLH